MEKLKITLKECCLDCEDFYATGPFGLGCANSREIGCAHMPVCYKYRAEKEENEENEELKPCPFCGEIASLKNYDGLYFVSCDSCGSMTTKYKHGKEPKESWNRRT